MPPQGTGAGWRWTENQLDEIARRMSDSGMSIEAIDRVLADLRAAEEARERLAWDDKIEEDIDDLDGAEAEFSQTMEMEAKKRKDVEEMAKAMKAAQEELAELGAKKDELNKKMRECRAKVESNILTRPGKSGYKEALERVKATSKKYDENKKGAKQAAAAAKYPLPKFAGKGSKAALLAVTGVHQDGQKWTEAHF
ncbi:hypothetical protein H4R18_003874 [Coemansia javaensis]|uniref:Uncharacterized protein n=1 Tax=Coemansia javaensis TaxID=2761396 RepID=A0A9W8HDB4_9FUNG|nr:hypothetical protein H4R18_003874 [Coemansia javaensis]